MGGVAHPATEAALGTCSALAACGFVWQRQGSPEAQRETSRAGLSLLTARSQLFFSLLFLLR